jgi:hypothetical protein
MATWATVGDVELYTAAEDVSETDVIRAEADIAMFVGTTPDSFNADYAAESDAYFLKLATCWQAYFHANGDAETFSHDITNTSQDGFSVTLTESGSVLHPKAKWAIQQLSWMKPKVVGGNSGRYGDYFNSLCTPSPFAWRSLR